MTLWVVALRRAVPPVGVGVGVPMIPYPIRHRSHIYCQEKFTPAMPVCVKKIQKFHACLSLSMLSVMIRIWSDMLLLADHSFMLL